MVEIIRIERGDIGKINEKENNSVLILVKII